MVLWRASLIAWVNKRIWDPLLVILRKGAEPKQLALSTALGVTLGVFPICGVTVLLCGMAIAVLQHRCHAPSIMLANFISTPIELSLVIPFLRLGEAISGGPHFSLTSDAFSRILTGEASSEIFAAVFHALLGWLIAAPFVLSALYVLLVPCFGFLVHKFRPTPSSPKNAPAADVTTPMTVSVKVRDL